MGSLRSFHLVFVLLAMIGADMFGAWAVWMFGRGGSTPTLALGLASFAGGLGLAVYAYRLVRKLDRAGVT